MSPARRPEGRSGGRRQALIALTLLTAIACGAPTAKPAGARKTAPAITDPVAGVPAPLPPGVPGRAFQRGMAYGIYGRAGIDWHRSNLEAIRRMGADSVQTIVPRPMRDVRATTVDPPAAGLTPTRESLDQAVDEAHRLGMRVLHFPILFIDNLDEGEWRGTLEPADWDRWWRSYTAFILGEARWAEERGVQMLSVGSELGSTEHFTERWIELIDRVRAVYGGQVTYSANWDHLEVLRFTDHLDFVGMNAYFEVGGPERSVAEMVAAWRRVLPGLTAWQESHGRPVVITEVGYPSRRGGTGDPWNHQAVGPPALAEQDRGYRAFMRAWSDVPWLDGVYFYFWWDDGGDTGYSPRGKPAGRSLSRWYTQD